MKIRRIFEQIEIIKMAGVKNLKLVLSFLMMLSIVIIILIGSFKGIINDYEFYILQHEKNGVYESLGKDYTLEITKNWIFFLQNKAELRFFEGDEKSHLYDVKRLYGLFNAIYTISIIMLIFSIIIYSYIDHEQFFQKFMRNMFYSSITCLILLLILFVLSLNFNSAFTQFHNLFFPQGNYLFPAGALIITIFSKQFFIDLVSKSLFFILVKITIILIITSIYLFVNKKKQQP